LIVARTSLGPKIAGGADGSPESSLLSQFKRTNPIAPPKSNAAAAIVRRTRRERRRRGLRVTRFNSARNADAEAGRVAGSLASNRIVRADRPGDTSRLITRGGFASGL